MLDVASPYVESDSSSNGPRCSSFNLTPVAFGFGPNFLSRSSK